MKFTGLFLPMHIWLILNLALWSTAVFGATRNDTPKKVATYQKTNITIGYLPAVRGDLKERKGLAISGAITLALEEINNDPSILPNVTLLLRWNDTKSDAEVATRAMLDMIRDGVSVFIGPEGSCLSAAQLAQSKNIPMIGYGCYDYAASEIPVFAKTEPLGTHIQKSIISLLMYFGWNKFSIVYEDNWETVAQAIKEDAKYRNITVNHMEQAMDPHRCCEKMLACCFIGQWNRILEKTKDRTRIYLYLGSADSLVYFMDAMELAQLFDNGEYMVIYVDTSTYTEPHKYLCKPIHTYSWCEQQPNFLKRGRSLFIVAPTLPSDNYYTKFATKVKEYNSKEPFNFLVPPFLASYHKFQFLTIYAGYLYDAVKLYARALHQLLNEQPVLTDEIIESIAKNGTKIIGTIINFKSYKSITGSTMMLDEFGNSSGNFTMLALKCENFHKKDNFTCTYQMMPVGQFHEDLPILKINKQIDWSGGIKPRDE